MTTVHYYDADAKEMRYVQATHVRSGAGYSTGPSYPVSYRLTDGSWLNGTRHADRGDLMTDITTTQKPRCTKPERALTDPLGYTHDEPIDDDAWSGGVAKNH